MTSIYHALAKLEDQNSAGVLCTIIRSQGSTPRHTTSKMLVYPDGRIVGTIGGGELENRVIREAINAVKAGAPKILSYQMSDPSRGDPGVCGGQVEIYMEPILPKPTLLVIGSGHVGKAVAHLADWLGFYVVVSDDRPEFCNPETIPEAKEFFPISMSALVEQFDITPWTYIVLTTRGTLVDVAGLPSLLASPAPYIGVIGSKRRWETTRKELLKQGIQEEALNQVHSPIGIELNAETPEEIAVSIMAEVLMKVRRGTGNAMSKGKKRPGKAI
jgi:xanthine dehydrogenase accessory factor